MCPPTPWPIPSPSSARSVSWPPFATGSTSDRPSFSESVLSSFRSALWRARFQWVFPTLVIWYMVYDMNLSESLVYFCSSSAAASVRGVQTTYSVIVCEFFSLVVFHMLRYVNAKRQERLRDLDLSARLRLFKRERAQVSTRRECAFRVGPSGSLLDPFLSEHVDLLLLGDLGIGGSPERCATHAGCHRKFHSFDKKGAGFDVAVARLWHSSPGRHVAASWLRAAQEQETPPDEQRRRGRRSF